MRFNCVEWRERDHIAFADWNGCACARTRWSDGITTQNTCQNKIYANIVSGCGQRRRRWRRDGRNLFCVCIVFQTILHIWNKLILLLFQFILISHGALLHTARGQHFFCVCVCGCVGALVQCVPSQYCNRGRGCVFDLFYGFVHSWKCN